MTSQLERSLEEMTHRIDELQQLIPPSWKEGEDALTDEMVNRIIAIESEWLVTPKEIELFSSIVLDEEDEEDEEKG